MSHLTREERNAKESIRPQERILLSFLLESENSFYFRTGLQKIEQIFILIERVNRKENCTSGDIILQDQNS